MKASLTDLRALYVALGVDTAGKYGVKQMAERLKTIGRLSEGAENLKEPKLQALYDQVAAAVQNGDPIEVEDDTAPVVESPDKPAGKKGGKAAGGKKSGAKRAGGPAAKNGIVYKPGEKGSWKKAVDYWKENPKQITARALVTRAVVAELQHAYTLAEPGITKDEIVGILAQQFPDRDPLKMRTFVGNLVPSRLACYFALRCEKVKRSDGKTAFFLPAKSPAGSGTPPKTLGKTGKRSGGDKTVRGGAKKTSKKSGKKTRTKVKS